jgi:hypothetical protein
MIEEMSLNIDMLEIFIYNCAGTVEGQYHG